MTDTLRIFLAEFRQRVVNQEGNIMYPLTEGRHREGDHRNPAKKVLTKERTPHPFLEALVHGNHHSYIDAETPRAAYGPDLAFLEDAEEFGLEKQGNFAGPAQNDRSPARSHEGSPLTRSGSGVCPFHVADDLSFDGRFADPAPGRNDEGLLPPRALMIEVEDDASLPPARLPLRENQDVSGVDLADYFLRSDNGWRYADEALELEFARHLSPEFEIVPIDLPDSAGRDPVAAHGLGKGLLSQEALSPCFHCAHDRGCVAEACRHDHLDKGKFLTDSIGEFQGAESRPSKIDQRDIHSLAREHREQLLAASGLPKGNGRLVEEALHRGLTRSSAPAR
ncbi:MAG: hypothetical protein WCQ50_18545 [Spirochaetota bacterium]